MAQESKIRQIDELALLTAEFRRTHKSVVHCHGVFDLLHVGHLRYFEEAKAMGDVLIVTLTTDKYVNKGSHRPAFPEQLRAEFLAALECVDFVAINPTSTAVEAIQALKPDIYVKGPDYKNPAADLSGGIVAEENAVRSAGGRLAFTSGVTFSSTALINRHIGILPQEVHSYLSDFATRYPADRIIEHFERARKLKVLLIGEPIIDEYLYCDAIGKSSKEPTMVVKRLSSEQFAGGILAAANHVAGFCDEVAVIGQLGTENSHELFIEGKLRPNIRRLFVHRSSSGESSRTTSSSNCSRFTNSTTRRSLRPKTRTCAECSWNTFQTMIS
jgi:rfaE bifunctional protein nucleotidyltransferase chain/domain